MRVRAHILIYIFVRIYSYINTINLYIRSIYSIYYVLYEYIYIHTIYGNYMYNIYNYDRVLTPNSAMRYIYLPHHETMLNFKSRFPYLIIPPLLFILFKFFFVV